MPLLDIARLDEVNIDARARVNAAVLQCLDQRYVRILEIHVLADHGDIYRGIGILLGFDDRIPFAQVGLRQIQTQLPGDNFVEPLFVHHRRYLVEVVGVIGRDNRFLLHVRKQRNLLALLGRQRQLGTTDQDIGLNTDGAQFLDRVLRRFRLDFLGCRDVGHQRQVHVDDAIVAHFDTHLANGLEKR